MIRFRRAADTHGPLHRDVAAGSRAINDVRGQTDRISMLQQPYSRTFLHPH
ncbi:hypothetical protein [Paenibacillus tarimensis]|uniref:hypothetical protein n=1 Tax=Paenibacillus tarimensis TaxID=416012 RepID=UPI001F2996E8|nr:hypothetical protein [Paenibacillus tarimensis]MCF2943584.1 hypothetical protein [Paenibacillus tarimensis]